MRYCIFSDIHGNLEAFNAMLKALRKEQIDRFVCLGDIVGYGPSPHQCISLVREIKSVNIAGNHDWAVAGILRGLTFNPDAACALDWTRGNISKSDKVFLRQLKLVYEDVNMSGVHSSLFNSSRFPYVYTKEDYFRNFERMSKAVCFIGHTHLPSIVTYDSRKILLLRKKEVSLKENVFYLCNVGSLGQPRDNNSQAAYCMYDSKKKLVQIRRISYNIAQVQSKIRKAKLPEFLAKRLGQGR